MKDSKTEIGIALPHFGKHASREAIGRVAQAAEQLKPMEKMQKATG